MQKHRQTRQKNLIIYTDEILHLDEYLTVQPNFKIQYQKVLSFNSVALDSFAVLLLTDSLQYHHIQACPELSIIVTSKSLSQQVAAHFPQHIIYIVDEASNLAQQLCLLLNGFVQFLYSLDAHATMYDFLHSAPFLQGNHYLHIVPLTMPNLEEQHTIQSGNFFVAFHFYLQTKSDTIAEQFINEQLMQNLPKNIEENVLEYDIHYAYILNCNAVHQNMTYVLQFF